MPCDKKAFGKKKAKKAARVLAGETGLFFRAYPCNKCRHWHLSTKGKHHPHRTTPKSKGGSDFGTRPAPGQTIEELARIMRRRATAPKN